MSKAKPLHVIFLLMVGCGAPAGDETAGDPAAVSPAGLLGEAPKPAFGQVNAEEPDLQLSERGLYFGELCGTDDAERPLTLANLGGAVLVVRALNINGQGFSLLNRPALPLVLGPGENFRLRVRFDPNGGRLAPFEGTIRILSNDPDEPVIDVVLGGLALPGSIRVTPRVVDFGSLGDGVTGRRNVVLRNNSDCAVNIAGVRVVGNLSWAIQVGPVPSRMPPAAVEPVRLSFECNGEDDFLDASVRFLDTSGRSVGSAKLDGYCNPPN